MNTIPQHRTNATAAWIINGVLHAIFARDAIGDVATGQRGKGSREEDARYVKTLVDGSEGANRGVELRHLGYGADGACI